MLRTAEEAGRWRDENVHCRQDKKQRLLITTTMNWIITDNDNLIKIEHLGREVYNKPKGITQTIVSLPQTQGYKPPSLFHLQNDSVHRKALPSCSVN